MQTELSDGVALLVGNNDRIQGIISQLEESCRSVEVSVCVLSLSMTDPFFVVTMKTMISYIMVLVMMPVHMCLCVGKWT